LLAMSSAAALSISSTDSLRRSEDGFDNVACSTGECRFCSRSRVTAIPADGGHVLKPPIDQVLMISAPSVATLTSRILVTTIPRTTQATVIRYKEKLLAYRIALAGVCFVERLSSSLTNGFTSFRQIRRETSMSLGPALILDSILTGTQWKVLKGPRKTNLILTASGSIA